MPLPKLNVPIYETKLPSTNEVIRYRPFLVKEEKILLTALESNETNSMLLAIKTIIGNCIQSEIDVEKLPMFDIEYLFLQLRSKSVGEKIEIGLKCDKCEKVNTNTIDLEKIQVHHHENHEKKFMLDDKIGIVMSYPIFQRIEGIEENVMEIVKDCIEMIFTEEETFERDSFKSAELDEFIDSLNSEQFLKIRKFFETMPKLKHEVEYTCSECNHVNVVTLEGLNSFFQ